MKRCNKTCLSCLTVIFCMVSNGLAVGVHGRSSVALVDGTPAPGITPPAVVVDDDHDHAPATNSTAVDDHDHDDHDDHDHAPATNSTAVDDHDHDDHDDHDHAPATNSAAVDDHDHDDHDHDHEDLPLYRIAADPYHRVGSHPTVDNTLLDQVEIAALWGSTDLLPSEKKMNCVLNAAYERPEGSSNLVNVNASDAPKLLVYFETFKLALKCNRAREAVIIDLMKKGHSSEEAFALSKNFSGKADLHAGHNHARMASLFSSTHDHEGHEHHDESHEDHNEVEPLPCGVWEEVVSAQFRRCVPAITVQCEALSDKQKWGYMLAGVTIVTLIGVFSIFLTYLFLRIHSLFLDILVCFACGALLADAFFHLLPLILGQHSHASSKEQILPEMSEELGMHKVNVRMTIILVTGLVFFIVDYALRVVSGGDHHASGDKQAPDSNDDDFINGEPKSVSKNPEFDSSVSEKDPKKSLFYFTPLKKIPFLVWVVTIGDFVHNATDGLSIGAAFCQGKSLGWTTVLASVFHEVPQEIGDFALLLGAGLSPIHALLFNLLAALSSYIGGIVSVSASGNTGASIYFLCITVGSFLYLGFGVLIPNILLSVKSLSMTKLATQLFGLVAGAMILFVIAITESEKSCNDSL